MDALKIDKSMLCGLSMGGYIAINAITSHPERFDALMLCDTTCRADTPDTKEKRLKTIKSLKVSGVERYATESLKNLFAPESFQSMETEISFVREMMGKTSKQTLMDTLLALAGRSETCSLLWQIEIPVLIMVGEKDQITPPAAAAFMHEQISDSTLKIIMHAGHLSNIENAPEFNDQLKKFVDAVYLEP
jgi:3-oxoadipate enol-lactonase